MNLKRIDKMIALNCNVSRKDARKLIKDGAVKLNGQQVFRAEELVDLEQDEIQVNGYDFSLKEHIYIMMNKPQGVISATDDPKKETVIDIVPNDLKRKSLFPCGRLDKDTTGLLIITDDGALAHKIMSPSHHVYKKYRAFLDHDISDEDISRLESGIILDDGTECLPAIVSRCPDEAAPCAEIKIKEGKYHQVKRMFSACENKVIHLQRLQIGALKLDSDLPEGSCRELTDVELNLLFENE